MGSGKSGYSYAVWNLGFLLLTVTIWVAVSGLSFALGLTRTTSQMGTLFELGLGLTIIGIGAARYASSRLPLVGHTAVGSAFLLLGVASWDILFFWPLLAIGTGALFVASGFVARKNNPRP